MMTQTLTAASKSVALDYDNTLVVAIELSNVSWVLAAQVPGLPRLKAKRSVEPTVEALMAAINGYRNRAREAGRMVERVVAVYEASWSGFWLARWLERGGIEIHIIQPSTASFEACARFQGWSSGQIVKVIGGALCAVLIQRPWGTGATLTKAASSPASTHRARPRLRSTASTTWATSSASSSAQATPSSALPGLPYRSPQAEPRDDACRRRGAWFPGYRRACKASWRPEPCFKGADGCGGSRRSGPLFRQSNPMNRLGNYSYPRLYCPPASARCLHQPE